MATASPTTSEPGRWLNDHQLSSFTGCVAEILTQISPHLTSDTDASAAVSAIDFAVRSACASFASQFNERNPRAVTLRLPVDVLIDVLYAADMPTRIRASHVSRTWRAAALAERGLWTVFSYPSAWEREFARPLLDFLEAVLRRSDPLPFQLGMDHISGLSDEAPASELAAIMSPHLHRLQVYEGPEYILELLNPAKAPLLELVSLNIVGDIRHPWSDRFTSAVRPQCLPNLRQLFSPVLECFAQTFYSLRELRCNLVIDGPSGVDLFRSFPNLVRAEFLSDHINIPLPPGPVPVNIEEIAVHCWPNGIDVAEVRVWAGEAIPRLVLLGLQYLDGVVSELLAAHDGPIAATIPFRSGKSDIVLADGAEPSRWCWAIETEYFWDSPNCADDLHQLFAVVQIVSLTMSIDYLLTSFEAPHLLSLKLSLTGVHTTPPSTWKGLRAPCLQHFVLDFDATDTDPKPDASRAEFEALRQNFRQLIVYDADLLETVTMRSSSRTPEDTDCAYFAQFARRYIDMITPH